METFDHSTAAVARQQQLYDNVMYSDLTIRINAPSGTRRVHAHRAILAISSTWFQHTLSTVGLELVLDSDTRIDWPKQTCIDELVLVANEGQATMERLLRHIYGFNVFPAPFPSTIYMDIDLLKLAARFEVATLLDKAQESIAGRLRDMKYKLTWTPTTCAVVLAEIYDAPEGGDTLRQLAVEACRSHMAELVAEDKFQETLLKYPEIASDLMKRPTPSVKSETQESNKRRRV